MIDDRLEEIKSVLDDKERDEKTSGRIWQLVVFFWEGAISSIRSVLKK